MKYKLVVVEMEDVVPRRDAGKPNLFVGCADAQLESLEEIVANAKVDYLKGNEKKLRPDLTRSTIFETRKGVRGARKKLISKLSNKGYTVNRDATVFRLYVIELDPEGLSDVGKGYVYVGETSSTREERFEQHRTNARSASGHKIASSVVYRRGQHLRHDLIPSGVYFSREAGKAAEARLAERLREQGYRVEGGH